MRRRYVLSTVVVALALWPEAAADATWQGKPGRLAYSNGGGIHTIGGHGRHYHLLAERGGGYGVAWSRKGRHLAYSTGSTLWVARADGSKRELVVSSDGRATVLRSPSWSPGGRSLSLTQQNTRSGMSSIYTIRRDGSHLRKLAEGGEGVWSKDGRVVYFSEQDGDIAQIDRGGHGYRVLAHQASYTHSLDLSPDGKRLVYETHVAKSPDGEEAATIYVLDVRTGKRTSFSADKLSTVDVVWTPSGRRLAFVYGPPAPLPTELRTIRPDGHGTRSVFRFANRNSVPTDLAWQTR